MSRNYGVPIPEVKLITFPTLEADQEPSLSPKSLRQGRPSQIPAPMDIRWPIVQEFLRRIPKSSMSGN